MYFLSTESNSISIQFDENGINFETFIKLIQIYKEEKSYGILYFTPYTLLLYEIIYPDPVMKEMIKYSSRVIENEKVS